MSETEFEPPIEIVPYDARWREAFAAERRAILAVARYAVSALEHIGSTAVPGLSARPVIDMMAAVEDLTTGHDVARKLAPPGYRLTETGMRNRLFLRRPAVSACPAFHLHIVTRDTWDLRKERLMRDYLISHPDVAAEYAGLKARRARQYTTDAVAYVRSKTAFIQELVDAARAELGLPSIDVWNE